MNIFILDRDPAKAAKYHCDKHVSKMILESAQMLSTVLGGPYVATHRNHPCTKWVAESKQNMLWLFDLMTHLDREYYTRYSKTAHHKSYIAVVDFARHSWDTSCLPDVGLTPFVQAMPDEYRTDDAVQAYRAYYKSKPFAEWQYSKQPEWW